MMRDTICEIQGNQFVIQYRVTIESGVKNFQGFLKTAQEIHFSVSVDGETVLLFKPGISKEMRTAITNAVIVDDKKYLKSEN